MSDSCFANWPRSRERLAEWYATPLGGELDGWVQALANDLLADLHGEHALQIGGSAHASDVLTSAQLGHRLYLLAEVTDSLRAEPEALPIASGSLNLLVVYHVIEYRAEPQALLREAERVLAPEGSMLLVAFNAWSLFGLRRLLPHDGVPWSGRFIGLLRLHLWLRQVGLVVEARRGCWRRPPVHGGRVRRWLSWMERGHWLSDRWGAVQILRVRKRRAPLTPIPLVQRWRRRLPAGQPARTGILRRLRAAALLNGRGLRQGVRAAVWGRRR